MVVLLSVVISCTGYSQSTWTSCFGNFNSDELYLHDSIDYIQSGQVFFVFHDRYITKVCGPGSDVGGLSIYSDFEFEEEPELLTTYGICYDVRWDMDISSTTLLNMTLTLVPAANGNADEDRKVFCGEIDAVIGSPVECSRTTFKMIEGHRPKTSGLIGPKPFEYDITVTGTINGQLSGGEVKKNLWQKLRNTASASFSPATLPPPNLYGNPSNNVIYLPPNVELAINNGSNFDFNDIMFCDASSKITLSGSSEINLNDGEIRHCDLRWDGIEMEGESITDVNSISLQNGSIIRGAARGIKVDGQSEDIEIVNSSILDCQIGIRAARTATGQSFSAVLDEATITIQDGVPPPSITAPSVSASFTGIEVVAYDDLDLETFVSSTMISNYDRGIRSVTTAGNIGNFNIRSCNIGVETVGGITDVLEIVNNTIANCDIGVDVRHTGSKILKNMISNCEEGIKADMATTGLFDAHLNTIEVSSRGILLKDLKEESTNNRITDNTITITTMVSEGFGGVGIEHNNADGLVRGNNITLLGNQIGVYSINGTDPLIQRNKVFILDADANAMGIRAENTTSGYYHENEIDGVLGEGFTESTGMYFSGSANSIVQCNVLKEVEVGFQAVGSNQNMTKQGTFHTVNRIATQLDINGAGQGAVIGDQGQQNINHYGNQWPVDASFIDAAHYTTDPIVVQQSQFYADKNNSTLWPSLIFTVDPQAVWFFPDIPTSVYDDCENYPDNINGGGMSQDFETSTFMMSGMSSSGLSIETQTSWLVQTYEMVNHHITAREYTSEELAFLQAYDDTDIAAIADAHHILKTQGAEGASAAGALLGSIDSKDAVLSTMQEAMLLWAVHLQDQEFTDGDRTSLEYIADLCTQEYGAAVAVARGLLTIDSPRIWDDAIACQQVEERSYITSEAPSLDVYPNPTTGVIQLGKDDIARVEVITLDGRIQLTSRGSDAIDLGDLPSAIYLIKAYSNDDEVIGIEKVIKLQ